MDEARLLLDLVWKVGLVLVGAYTWWSNRDKATKAAIDRVEKRVIRVEEDMRHQPSRAEMHELNVRIGALHADLQELVGSFRGVQRAVDLMHQHLLDRNTK